MATTNNGTAVLINASYLPSGYTVPTVTKVTDYEARYDDEVITIAKSGVENANKVTTFTQLVAAITAAVTALVNSDFDETANTITVYANLKVVSTNFNMAGVLYSNGAINYLCTVDIFVKTVLI